jgi:dihydropteroate synthase
MLQMTINCKGKLLDLSQPVVMGILNVTPDSFFDGGKWSEERGILSQVDKMLFDGAAIIDVGGMSSRPGAEVISTEEELKRVIPVIKLILQHFSDAIVSVDTIRANVARAAIENGAAIVNDISGGTFDNVMISTVASLRVPYVVMHKKGMPADMQHNPVYDDVVSEVFDFLQQQVRRCKQAGIKDVIVDVGFGFGKTLEQNFALLRNLDVFQQLNCPILLGISRKSIITKTLKIKTDDALNGTTALNMLGLEKGANILRVHDIKETVETAKLYNSFTK